MKFFRKYHKWAGLFLAFFLILFSVSGIILNHRKIFSGVDISRNLLPKDFHYDNWNNASVKGSIKLSSDSILLYGGSGIWLTDSLQNRFSPFIRGLDKGIDNQITNSIVQAENDSIYAITTFDLYTLSSNNGWKKITEQAGINERINDMTYWKDTLAILTRSHLYYSIAPFHDFCKVELQKPIDYEAKTSLFRTFWLLHSGKLFGTGGKLFVDILGVLLIIISVTGIIYFFSPRIIKRRKKKNLPADVAIKTMKSSIRWHNKIGVVFLLFFLLLTLSGMFLRPPLMIAIIRNKINNPKGTMLNSDNPWQDKLRAIRYDKHQQQWLLYTSDGFYSLNSFDDIPEKVMVAPPVSVMGVTVLEPTRDGWLVGSFSGLFSWSRQHNLIINCYTGQPLMGMTRGRPVSLTPISGYSSDFEGQVVFEYAKGAVVFDSRKGFAPMPEEIGKGRISLYHAALEIHTGRAYAYLLGLPGDTFTFFSGLFILILLISGYIVYRKKYQRKKTRSYR